MVLDPADDLYLKPQKDADAVPHFYNVLVRGTTKIVGASNSGTDIILCNYNGSGAETLVDGLKDLYCDYILGVYCEGGVYHIAAEVRGDYNNDPQAQITVFIKDGSSISSVGILPMPQ